MPPFWVGFSKQRKKPGWRRSSNCVQNAFFSTFPILARQKKQPWDQILKFRFHDTILGGLFQAAEKAGFTKVVQLRSKRVLLNFPIGGKRKNSLGIEFYNFGFMPPFWVGFSKQRKKPGWQRSSNCVQNAFFQLFPSWPDKKKTAVGSNFTISVPCHHFGWVFQAAEKAGFTKVVQLRSKRVLLNFPIGGKRKNSLGIEFYNFGFMPPFWVGFSKQRKKPGWQRSSNCVQNAFFQLFPSWPDKKKTAVGSNFTISVSCHHFGWVFQAAEKAGFTKVVQLRSKRVLLNFPIGGKRKNSRGIKFYNFSFMPPFWVGFPSSGKSRVHESGQIAFKTLFVKFPHRGETKKHPWDRILKFRFHSTILGGLFEAAEKPGYTKVVQLRSKRVLLNFPIGGKRKNILWIEF